MPPAETPALSDKDLDEVETLELEEEEDMELGGLFSLSTGHLSPRPRPDSTRVRQPPPMIGEGAQPVPRGRQGRWDGARCERPWPHPCLLLPRALRCRAPQPATSP